MSSGQFRILIVDDSPAIHDDITKILVTEDAGKEELNALEADFFGDDIAVKSPADSMVFVLDSAFQGEEGVSMVSVAKLDAKPYTIAIVDARMPPGINGIDAIEQMQAIDPDLQIVFCTAYSDYSWDEIRSRVGQNDQLIVLKKPFDSIELIQLSHVLASKWSLSREVKQQIYQLQTLISDRTVALDLANGELRQRVDELERMEIELRTAQKMEAVGQLASGIAHEINTPVQYVGDGVYFLHSAFESFAALFPLYRESCEMLSKVPGHELLLTKVNTAQEQADLPFLLENVPSAFERVFDGIDRVATIVKAMKDYAHPGVMEKDYADLNEAIRNTLIVAKGEYKHVAEAEVEFGELPQVVCHIGDFNQALLNLVVNAAHAIEKRMESIPGEGRIHIDTRVVGDLVQIKISDNGSGIPDEIQQRIFEPFFTTKEVGKGTGQGLAMVYSTVVEKHGGELIVDSKVGEGTCFTIRLPVAKKGECSVEVVQ